MGTQGAGRKRSTNKDRTTAEDDALNLIAREAEARLAAKRAARAEAREIRMKELERQQKEKYYGLSPKDERQDGKWGDIEQWMEDSERYTRPSRNHTLSDEDERMSVGSRGSVRSDLEAAYTGGADSSYSLKKSKKKKKHKHRDKDRNGFDDDYSVASSRSSRLSDESRVSRSSRLDLTSGVLTDESRASRSRLDLQPTSYASSDLYSLNGLSSSRPAAAYNGYQSSLYEDGLCSSSRRTSAQVPLEYSSYRSSGSRTSSRASSRAGSARTSPVDNSSSSVASYLRSAVSSGLRDLDDVTIPDFADVEDGSYLEKGSRAASALTASTLTSLGGTSSRRGSGETALTLDAETSIREIKEIHELKDQIQDVESKYNQNLKEAKDKLAEVEEKYRKAMVSNAQLDNEKNKLMYQVDTLKDSLLELEESLAESRRQYDDKAKDFEREKHTHTVLQFQFNELKETLKQSEDLLNKHGIVLGPDLTVNGGVTEVLGVEASADPNSPLCQVSSPTEGGNSMLGNSEEEAKETCRLPTPAKELQIQEIHEGFETQNLEDDNNEGCESILETFENRDQEKPIIEHLEEVLGVVGTDQVEYGASFQKDVVEVEPIDLKNNIEFPKLEESRDGKIESKTHLEKELVNVEQVDCIKEILKEPIQSNEVAKEDPTAKESKNSDPIGVVASNLQIQQDLETLDCDSEDVSTKTQVTSGGGKKKKRKKRGKKKGQACEDKREHNIRAGTKSRDPVVDGKVVPQLKTWLSKGQSQEELIENGKVSDQNSLAGDSKDDPPTQILEQARSISEIGDIQDLAECGKVQLKANKEESNAADDCIQHNMDNGQTSTEKDLVEFNKIVIQQVLESMSNVQEIDSLTNGCEKVEPKVIKASADTLETEQAEVLSDNTAVGKTFYLEEIDEKEQRQSLDYGVEECQVEASLETFDGNGSNLETIGVQGNGNVGLTMESSLPNADEAAKSESKIIEGVEKQNDKTSIEREHPSVCFDNSQMENSGLDVPNENEESLGGSDDLLLPDRCKSKDSDFHETPFVAEDEILINTECSKLQIADSNQASTYDLPIITSDMSIITSDMVVAEVVAEVVEKVEASMNFMVVNDVEDVVSNVLNLSQFDPCSNDNNGAEEANLAEFKPLEKDVTISDILRQEDSTNELLTDDKEVVPIQNVGNGIREQDKVDTSVDNAAQIHSEIESEEFNEDKVEVGDEVNDFVLDDISKDQLTSNESQSQGEIIVNDLIQLEIVHKKAEIACQDVEVPERSTEEEATSSVACQNKENPSHVLSTKDTGAQCELMLTQSANDEENDEPGEDGTKLEELPITSEPPNPEMDFTKNLEEAQNITQEFSNLTVCPTIDWSEEEAKPDSSMLDGEEEDEAEGLSFDFDDLEMEAAIAQSSECKTDEFELGEEVLPDEEHLNNDFLDNQQENCERGDIDKDGKVDEENKDNATLESPSLTSQLELSEKEFVTSLEQSTPAQNKSGNNNKQSSPVAGGSDLRKTQRKERLGGKGSQETVENAEQNQSGKRSSKKGKGKGKDECKMT